VEGSLLLHFPLFEHVVDVPLQPCVAVYTVSVAAVLPKDEIPPSTETLTEKDMNA